MALNFSACSMFSKSEDRGWRDGFSGCGGGGSGGGGGGGFWSDNASLSPCYGGDLWWRELDDYRDPVELLPSDPFGMNLETTFTAAIARCIGDLTVVAGDNHSVGEILFSDLNYYLNRALAISPRTRNSGGGNGGSSGCEPQDIVVEAVGNQEEFPSCGNSDPHENEGVPHEGLFFSLGFLELRDLLTVEMVCKSLCSAVHSDPLLWRCVHIDSALSEKITDNDILHLAQKNQGALQCLSLVGCSKITDHGLKLVLEASPRLTKLNIVGCVRLSLEGLIDNLKSFKCQAVVGIKHLKLGKLFSVSQEQFDELTLLLGVDQPQKKSTLKPRFCHVDQSSFSCDDECALDIEMCPICKNYKLVYDCPLGSCKQRVQGLCRACDICIPRCIQCGKCIRDEFVETFCLEYLCSSCWRHPSITVPEKSYV